MEKEIASEAEAIIQEVEQGNRADAVMRQRFKADRTLSPSQKREVSSAVFAFYRWYGWLDSRQTLTGKVFEAEGLANQLAVNPDSFLDTELVQNSVPAWVRLQVEVTPAFARTLQAPPNIWLRTKRAARADVMRALPEARPPFEKLPEALLYEDDEDLFRTPEFHQGLFEIQDISSQVVGRMCNPQPKQSWWDACAGEGGKMLHLSDLMGNSGLIWASDAADWRLKQLKRRAGRASVFNYRAALWNGSEKLPTKTKFDGILVDAPCSGVGTWQRNPHARWTTTEKDVQELAALQTQLLHNVAGSLKPGGSLIYSVCTLTRAETTEVAQKFTRDHPEYAPHLLKNPLTAEARPEHLLLPQNIRGNGMYIAAWKRPA